MEMVQAQFLIVLDIKNEKYHLRNLLHQKVTERTKSNNLRKRINNNYDWENPVLRSDAYLTTAPISLDHWGGGGGDCPPWSYQIFENAALYQECSL